MRKRLLAVLLSISAFAIMIPAVASAEGEPSPPSLTVVSGTVTNNGNPVVGANVSVSCDGNILTSSTNASGGYVVQYSTIALCPNGATATATATKGGLNGSNSGPVSNVVPNTLNISTVNVSVVPELGALTGVGAAIIGGAAFMVVRRKHLHQN
jgi:hypothetical protein